MEYDTTKSGYWMNWTFLICGTWLLTFMVVCVFIVWKYEGPKKPKSQITESTKETIGTLHEHEAWRSCFKVVHPAWLLGFRLVALSMLVLLLVSNIVFKGTTVFYFYTQWTFTLVTIYFGFASVFSMYGCCHGSKRVVAVTFDVEEGIDKEKTSKSFNSNEEVPAPKLANMWGYTLQIIYQTCAGSVVLTDCVFWCLIYPFLQTDDYELDIIDVGLHSLNAVFLIGDMLLNSLRFPFFRMSYFILWTGLFVVFQWILHVCVWLGWPYPFLDLNFPLAPLWYVAVGLMHLPCYGVFSLLVKIKHASFSRLFPNAYRCKK